ncbi:hypothetical protein BGZ58_004007 [Dissophora ornata]|nr:hypothetical protein BGZ58_004007 [Dissophora ornata]
MNPYSEFTCLYTSQKLKKAKTWQDGATIAVGDDMDMDKHLITIEDLTVAYAANSTDQRVASNPAPVASTTRRNVGLPSRAAPARASVAPPTAAVISSTAISSSISISGLASVTAQQPENNTHPTSWSAAQSNAKRKKWRPPVPGSGGFVSTSLDTADDDWDLDAISVQDLQDTFGDAADGLLEPPVIGANITTALSKQSMISTTTSTTPTSTAQIPTPKRRRVGLSKLSSPSSSALGQSSLKSPHRPPSTQLEFPNAARCTNFTGKNSRQLLRRSLALGSRFMTTNQYKDGMSFLIYEHLQILVIEIAITMWSIKTNPNTREGEPFDALYRSRGIHMHSASSLRRRGDAYAGFPMYSERSFKGAGDISGGGGGNLAAVQTTSQQGASLSITNKEHHSKYSKDDLWVVSTTPRFDASSTFFARSVFYGPSGSDVDVSAFDGFLGNDVAF